MSGAMVKRTFSLPRDLLADLDRCPNKSQVVREALRRELDRLRREEIARRLLEAYGGARKGKALEVDRAWEKATLESWPEA